MNSKKSIEDYKIGTVVRRKNNVMCYGLMVGKSKVLFLSEHKFCGQYDFPIGHILNYAPDSFSATWDIIGLANE